MVVGALIASVEHLSNHWIESEMRHSVIAFGGGVLISAVSLVLVPEGIKHLPPFFTIFWFGIGGLVFMAIEVILGMLNEKASQLIAMIADFIPEVMALGAFYLIDKTYAILLAFLIILQNIPEGFNAYLELCKGHRHKGRTVITYLFMMSFLGPLAGFFSYYFLSDNKAVISAVMLFASGGILYLVFQDIAPQSKVKYRKGPALGAVGGFLFGMVGKMLALQVGS